MKKLILCLIAILMCGCANEGTVESEKKTMYQDGTYTASATGYGGEFQVETTIQDDTIQDVIVKEHNETPSIGGVAIEQMIKKIKQENKYDVDTISGATKSSQALKDAVKASMEKAKNQTE